MTRTPPRWPVALPHSGDQTRKVTLVVLLVLLFGPVVLWFAPGVAGCSASCTPAVICQQGTLAMRAHVVLYAVFICAVCAAGAAAQQGSVELLSDHPAPSPGQVASQAAVPQTELASPSADVAGGEEGGFVEASSEAVAAQAASAQPADASPDAGGILKRTRPVRTNELEVDDTQADTRAGMSEDRRNVMIGAVVATFGAVLALLGGARTLAILLVCALHMPMCAEARVTVDCACALRVYSQGSLRRSNVLPAF